MATLQRTTFLFGNLHCPSCVHSIESLLTTSPISLDASARIEISLLTSLLTFSHPPALLPAIESVLVEGGFEIIYDGSSPSGLSTAIPLATKWWESQSAREKKEREKMEEEKRMGEAHLLACRACREGTAEVTVKGKGVECVVKMEREGEKVTTLVIGGMTCSSCLGSINSILSSEADGRIREATVTLLPGRAVVRHSNAIKAEELKEMIEDGGFDAEVVESEDVVEVETGWVETRLLLEGLTCSSCVGAINSILDPTSIPGIRSAIVTLLPPLAVVVHDPLVVTKEKLVDEIEDGGYGATVISSVAVRDGQRKDADKGVRTVKLRIDGMFCGKCSSAINAHLADLESSSLIMSFTTITLEQPFTTISYIPRPPSVFTLRHLQSQIAALGPFTIHPINASTTLASLSQRAATRESHHLLLLLLIAFIFAIPTFVIAIVAMSLLPPSHPLAVYFNAPIWNSATRGTLSLFALATPVQFGVGSMFYRHAWASVRGVWKRKGAGRWKDRLLRWGSMDTLVALGTTTAWVASVAFMILDGTTQPIDGMGGDMSYFDSSVFLILFILAGRWLEGVSKRRTGEQVEKLGKMKPVVGILFSPDLPQEEEDLDERGEDDKNTTGTSLALVASLSTPSIAQPRTSTVSVDFLEMGDTLLIPPGSSVPLDSILLPHSPSSSFDESSLTGESLPLLKSPASEIYAGSTNLGPAAVIVRVVTGPGETMMDGIVGAVREAMGRKASIERFADRITGYFVPAIVAIAGLTFGIWIVRGYSGTLPEEWLDERGKGGWALFAVQFAVAVLVVACPCGIGLAAPTAQMVGTGIAARLGIVPYGGGEAFQNASKIDCVVFDKTGTITQGQFSVTSHSQYLSSLPSTLVDLISPSIFWKVIEVVEETSGHTISVGVQSFCRSQLSTLEPGSTTPYLLTSEEIPGQGIKALVTIDSLGTQLEVLIGNALLLSSHSSIYPSPSLSSTAQEDLHTWSSGGNSLVFLSLRLVDSADPTSQFYTVGLFALRDPPRPEAAYVIKTLVEEYRIPVYLCTGDNQVTAFAVGKEVGIEGDRIFAGVLPMGKSEVIERLQRGGARDAVEELRKGSWWRRKSGEGRIKVLFVGDGINDIVALTQADVGVSMGTGASVALSSSDFCLLSSNLLSLLTVLDLAKATFNKIITNFVWACCFNTVLIPIAAGAFYDLGRTQLPPVWASLAMALSSVSVVTNSLALRWTFRAPKAVRAYKGTQ